MRLGILAVHDQINLDAVRGALPPGHRVVGLTTRLGGRSDLVIAGPHMPEVADDFPMPRVELHFVSHLNEFGEAVRATIWWEHLPDVTWTVDLPAGDKTMARQCRDNVVAFPR